MPFTRRDLDWFAVRLLVAVEDTRRLGAMSVHDLRQALSDIPGAESLTISYAASGNQVINLGDLSVEVGPMASNDEIRVALQNPFIKTENTRVSITGYEPGAIRAKLDAIKQQRQERRAAAMAKLEAANAKVEQVDQALELEAAKMDKEADDALQEFAQHSNGGPA